jgi:hypothetical protein
MYYLTFVIFMTVVLAVTFGGHYAIYRSLVYFFEITAVRIKFLLFSALVFLSISYVLASLISRVSENQVTRFFYYISSLWLGIAAHLLLGIGIAWVLLLFARSVHLDLDTVVLGVFVLVGTVGFSVYGAINVRGLTVKNLTVSIAGLPAEWQGKKIAQISDVHLGYALSGDFLESIVSAVNREKVEAVVITGDLLDGMDYNLDAGLESLENLTAPKGAFYITGNHETYLGVARAYEALRKQKNVHILDDAAVNEGGLQIVGVSSPEQRFTKDVVGTIRAMKGFSEKLPTILLYHNPASAKEIAQSGLVDLQLSGHTHHGQIVPAMLFSRLVYGKYYFGEHHENDYTLYTTSGAGVWGPTMRTGSSSEIVIITLEKK